ncbi:MULTISPECIES: restriction endonuclease subunit S [unclassified Brevundimonas]|uniref:restriction endonuclease subunit S n=1 Tax=unclassified Brevundimonas TaxID=2622653 RepID=UPI0025BECF91|nr:MULTISPECIES: restriction endonuclease subunit S [unclassified Brevundimonas]
MTLPQGWAETTLGELVEVNPKHAADIDRTVSVSFVPMPVVDEVTGRITDPIDRPLDEVWKDYTHFSDGDVIFAKITPCMENGKSAIASGLTNGLACGSTEFFVFRSQGAIEPAYLWRFLRQTKFREEAAKVMTGAVGQRRVPRAWLENYNLGVAPRAEQRRIVAKLDALTARLARAKLELSRAQKLVAKERLAILGAAFQQFRSSPRARLDELCRVGTGSTPRRSESRYYSGGSVPWVTSGAVNDGVVSQASEHITDAALKETNCKVFPSGSILIALYGEGKTRGMVATLAIAAATNQALAVLHAFDRDRVEPDWIELFLLGRYEETRRAAAGGVQPNLNLGIVKAIELPVPPVSAQQATVAYIKSAFARADRVEAEARKALALIDRLETAILARAFRGELVPQDPNDEPASVLLERIRARRAAEPKPKRGRRPKLAS